MKMIMTLLVVALAATGAMATKPIQLSLTPDVSLFGQNEKIEGVTLSLWGENPQSGLALGIVNGSSGQSAGLSVGCILNYADNYTGIQVAPINYAKGDVLGWQAGFVNYTDGYMKGLQTGVVNYAGRLTGLQFGLVNFAQTAETGLQIGLLNLMPQNPWFIALPDDLAPAMILVNWRF